MTDTLIARLEAATGPDRELDAFIESTFIKSPNVFEIERSRVDETQWLVKERDPSGDLVDLHRPLAYTASIDAALTLATGEAIERVGGAIGILRWAIDMMREAGAGIDALPRFIVIATLRALEGEE